MWNILERAIASDRLSHGILIHGVPGVGKRLFAEGLASALLCHNKDRDGRVCGQCVSCRQFAAGTHPDVTYLTPEEPGRLIKVDRVRAFERALHLTPQYEQGRLGWIDPADALSKSASNTLLKTLEEPPLGSHIVLISDRLSALMPTIRSRVQHWHLSPAVPEVGAQWLENQAIDTAKLNSDSLRTPFNVLTRDRQQYDELAAGWDRDLASLLAGRADAIDIAERVAKESASLWIDWAYGRAITLLAARMGAEVDTTCPQALLDSARHIDSDGLRTWAARVADAARLRHTNAEWRLVVESVLLGLSPEYRRQGGSR